MSGRRKVLARAWIRKARNDLFTARKTLASPDAPTDTPCFHAQQAVGKSLKAVLTSRGVVTARTHDLLALLDKVLAFAPELDRYRSSFSEMSSYAVEIRYPTDWFEPLREEADEALSIAEAVVDHAEALIGSGGPA